MGNTAKNTAVEPNLFLRDEQAKQSEIMQWAVAAGFGAVTAGAILCLALVVGYLWVTVAG